MEINLLRVPVHEIGEQAQPRLSALFRVELHGEDVVPRDGRSEVETVTGLAGDQRGLFGLEVVAVDEIKPAVLRDAAPERVRSEEHTSELQSLAWRT